MPDFGFEKYISQPTIIPDNAIMSARNGLENRYASRFVSYNGATDDSLKETDQARSNVGELQKAVGVIETQQENINSLFTEAEMIVNMIDNFQRESGNRLVRNVPTPNTDIRSSYSKKLSYVQLILKFSSSGLLHFMETAMQMKEDLRIKDNVIKSIANNRVEIPIIGQIQEMDLDDLLTDEPIVDTKPPAPVVDAEHVGPKNMPTPPKTPTPPIKDRKIVSPTPASKTKK